MPVVVTTVLPPEATLELVLAIESHVPTDYPDSFIAHAVTYDEATKRVRLIDFWESREARDAWFLERAHPVIRREAAKVGITNPTPESSDASEAHVLLIGPGARTPA
jgi:hypothetical protein